MKTRSILALAFAVLVAGAPVTVRSAEKGKGLGDGHDGSRAAITHLISLFDESGLAIKVTDKQPRPVSMRKTCGECHNYDQIAAGWHFHSGSTNSVAGRSGEPWVLTDLGSRSQIPMSNRDWKGTYSPSELSISPWKFLKRFSSHYPGGNYGEMPPADDDEDADPEEFLRWPISGQYEINCLACHHADPRQDQSGAALQAARQNYRWAATVASGLATVKGNASELDEFYDPETEYKIRTTYDKSRFDANNKVFFDIVRKPAASRCYFCHSTQDMDTSGKTEWTHNEDIHLASGMSCADCHRNGANHMISRGDIEPLGEVTGDSSYAKAYEPANVAALSCRGCHLGNPEAGDPSDRLGGHLGAPVPAHKGLPPVHLEKLSCTACHSGTFPASKAGRVRTSRIHKLGLHGRHDVNKKLPHVLTPVFARMDNGKIGPHNMFWPAYWGGLAKGKVTPVSPDLVKELASDALGLEEENVERVDDWKPLSDEQIVGVLKQLAGEFEAVAEEGQPKPEPVYIAGGRLYRGSNGVIVSEEHEAAEPYKWPIAHNVRPAAQSLGANGRCADCHDNKSPFIFGQVGVDSPIAPEGGRSATREMVEFEELDRGYFQMFAFTFLFRPWLKVVVIISCALLGMGLLLFALKGLDNVVKAAGKKVSSKQ